VIADAYPQLLPIEGSSTDFLMPDRTRVRLAYLNTEEDNEVPPYITQGPKYDRLLLIIDNNGIDFELTYVRRLYRGVFLYLLQNLFPLLLDDFVSFFTRWLFIKRIGGFEETRKSHKV
jgi:hypothetical protein